MTSTNIPRWMKKVSTKASLATAVDQNRDGYIPGNQYKAGSFVSKEYLGSLDLNNASLFEKRASARRTRHQLQRQKAPMAAGYLRFDQKLGKSGI